jgi:CRP-like cAMP-binding protein
MTTGTRRRTGVDVAAALAATDLFGGLSAAVLDALAAAAVPRRFDKGALLFGEGDPGAALLVVTSGAVSVFRTSPSGERAVLAVLRPPEVFGELALLDGAPRSAGAEAIAPTTVLAMRREAFVRLLSSQPALVEPLLGHLGAMIRRLSEQAADHVFLDLGGRVAKALLRLANGSDPRAVTLTQGRLAELVGGSRQSVNGILGGLAERGIVRVDGRRILLVDEPALRRRAGLPRQAAGSP